MSFSGAPGASERAFNLSNEKANESSSSSVVRNYLDKLYEDAMDVAQAIDTSLDANMKESINKQKIGDK